MVILNIFNFYYIDEACIEFLNELSLRRINDKVKPTRTQFIKL